MAIASHLKLPLQRCQRETTSTEFNLWKLQLEKELFETTTDQYYLAQIAMTVARVLAKNPNSIKLKSFLFDFTHRQQQELSPEMKLANSKAFWFSLADVSSDGGVSRT